MPENNENNVVMEPVATEPVAPEKIDIPESSDKGDIIVGIIGAGVCLLAVPTVIRGAKWIFKKASGFFAKRKEADEGFNEEFDPESDQ